MNNYRHWSAVSLAVFFALLILGNALLTIMNINGLGTSEAWVTHTQKLRVELESLASNLKDAETGTRGYIITEDPAYLVPYQAASASIPHQIDQLIAETVDNPLQQARLTALRPMIEEKLVRLKTGVETRRTQGFEATRALILTGRGKDLMNTIRSQLSKMLDEEDRLLEERQQSTARLTRLSYQSALFVAVLGLILVGSGYVLYERQRRIREDGLRLLQTEKNRLEIVLRGIGDGVIVTDRQGRIEFMNAVAVHLTGWNNYQGEPIDTVFRIINEQTRAPVEQPVQRVLLEGRIVGLANHTILIDKQGVERPIDDSAAPLFGANDQLSGVVLVFRDRSEKYATERALLQSEAEFRTMFEQSTLGKAQADPDDGRLLRVNPRLTEMTGYSKPELNQMRLLDLVHPDEDRTRIQEIQQLLEGSRNNMSATLYCRHKEGRDLRIRVTIHRVTGEYNSRRYLAATFEDVTRIHAADLALREGEQRLRSVLDHANIYIALLHPDSRLLEINTAMQIEANMPRRQIVGQRLADLPLWNFSAAVQAQVQDVFKRALQGEIVRCEVETCIQLSGSEDESPDTGASDSGVLRRIGIKDFSLIPVYEDGRILHLVLSASDITERKKIAEALQTADQRKDEFLAMLGHELRNPLAPIRTAVELLRRNSQGTSAILQQTFGVIARQSAHLEDLVNDLLDVARINSGKIMLQMTPVPVIECIERAIELTKPLIDAQQHHFSLHLPNDTAQCKVMVAGDLHRLTQVIGNLLNNAAKYTEPGGSISLTMNVIGSADPEVKSGMVEIRIKDNGIGIAADVLPEVFDIFIQSKRALDRAQGGLGIGLTLVHRIVTLHGGQVRAYSQGQDYGSEFTITLPALPEQTAIEDSAAPMHTNSPMKKRRVLIVDDNIDATEMMMVVLEMSGHSVFTAHDGPQALLKATAEPPDIIFLDIGLPGMNGFEVARAMRKMPALAGVVLVALTGYGQSEHRVESEAAGFDHHLVKPVDPQVVLDLIEQTT